MHTLDRRSALKLGTLAFLAPGVAALAACSVAGSKTTPAGPVTIENVRSHIVGVDTPVTLEDGSTRAAIAFDNAATTPAFREVVDAIVESLDMYGSIGRGFSQKSDTSTDFYNETRNKVIEFLGGDPETYTCFYVNSTTDGINKLASALVEDKKTVVLTTRAEHHSNDLPWRERCEVIYAEVDELGRIKYDDIEKLLDENKVDYVSVTAATNVTGYVTDVHRVAKMAHAAGAKIIVDGAQIVSHRAFSLLGDTPEENIDFIAFSAHKMYTPFGGGAVVGLTEVLNEHQPEFYGGGTVRVVGDDWVVYREPPAVYEAGSPNYLAAVGLSKAIDILQEVGFDAIQEHEQKLVRRLIDGLVKMDTAIVYGDTENIDDKVGVVSFNFSDINTHVLARHLADAYGIATRRGAFCAHPYVWRLMGVDDETAKGFLECVDVNTAGMIRASFGIYNTEEEVDELLSVLPQAIEEAKVIAETEYSRADPEY